MKKMLKFVVIAVVLAVAVFVIADLSEQTLVDWAVTVSEVCKDIKETAVAKWEEFEFEMPNVGGTVGQIGDSGDV